MLKFSIIIPVTKINDYIRESIRHILNLDYQDFEVLVFPDEASEEKFPKTQVIPTGKIGPAEKRNLSLKYAQGEILAFLDDDAYPKIGWLSGALYDFQNFRIAALGGPAITPPQDNIFQKTSGACFSSSIFSEITNRYWPGKKRKMVQDWPSVNFFIRQEVFQKVGGFDSQYWPGEDTKLCFDITRRGDKILYDPQVLVYHHRRKNLWGHLKQVGAYGLHRGFFAKRFPQTSCKLTYFIPSLFIIFIILALILTYLFPRSLLAYFCIAIFFIYGGGLIFSAVQATVREKTLLIGILVIPYILLTHLVYGVRFLQGLFLTRELKSRLRK